VRKGQAAHWCAHLWCALVCTGKGIMRERQIERQMERQMPRAKYPARELKEGS
jgi:hypothetical protein